MMSRAFSPNRCDWAPETQADGLGWYGGAPSVLSFAATCSSTPQVCCSLLGSFKARRRPGISQTSAKALDRSSSPTGALKGSSPA
jgi:hypothetical protein